MPTRIVQRYLLAAFLATLAGILGWRSRNWTIAAPCSQPQPLSIPGPTRRLAPHTLGATVTTYEQSSLTPVAPAPGRVASCSYAPGNLDSDPGLHTRVTSYLIERD